MDLSHLIIDEEMKKMFIINAEFDEKLGLKEGGEIPSSSGNDNNTFNLEEISINYYRYNITLVNELPEFNYEHKILENTSLGFPCKNLVLSNSPRILIVNNGYESQDLFLYTQKINSSLDNYIKEKNYLYKRKKL